MTVHKKSLIIHADLQISIEHLTNEEKGILFNHILEYANGRNPKLENRVIYTAWKPIELQLNRDWQKYKEESERRSKAGKLSAEARSLKRDEQKLTNSTSVNRVNRRSTNPTDNDNDNDTDNDTDNDNVINNIESRKLKFADTLKPFIDIYGKDLIDDFFSYWTEPNKSNTKFKQELEKTWDNKRRLEKWKKNDKSFNKNTNEPIQPKYKIL